LELRALGFAYTLSQTLAFPRAHAFKWLRGG
jgi:hypothetical protein